MRTWTLSSFASFFPVNWWGMVYMGILFWVLNDKGIFTLLRSVQFLVVVIFNNQSC